MFFKPDVGFCDLGTYAGIGSRKITRYISIVQAEFAFCMTFFGFKLSSGGADGSDSSYEFGAKAAYDVLSEIYNLPKGEYERVMRIYLPWNSFNGRFVSSGYTDFLNNESFLLSQQHHKGWQYLSSAVRQLMARNAQQALGDYLNSPVNFVMCHTGDGVFSGAKTTDKTGGTGQAIRIATANSIPVYNTGNTEHMNVVMSKLVNARKILKENFGIDSKAIIEQKYINHNPIKNKTYSNFKDLLLNGQSNIFIHGCNCQGKMGSGIAKDIRDNFNEAYQADLATRIGDIKKLGSYTSALIRRNNTEFRIVNAYTQFRYGRDDKLYADYEAIRKSMRAINADYKDGNILVPRLGSGLSNGCWITVSNIIKTEFRNRDVTLLDDPNFENCFSFEHSAKTNNNLKNNQMSLI